jgi:hypothetical protein
VESKKVELIEIETGREVTWIKDWGSEKEIGKCCSKSKNLHTEEE